MSGVHKTTPGFGSSLKELKDSACGYPQAKSASEKGAWGGVQRNPVVSCRYPEAPLYFLKESPRMC